MRPQAALLSLLLITAGTPALAQSTDFAWAPGWEDGDYWIVETARWTHLQVGYKWEVQFSGFDYTRFIVRETVDLPLAGAGWWSLEVVTRHESETDYDERLTQVLVFSPSTGKLHTIVERTLDSAGEVVEKYHTAWASDSLIEWPSANTAVPSRLLFAWPMVGESGSDGVYGIGTITLTSESPQPFVYETLPTQPGELGRLRMYDGLRVPELEEYIRVFRPGVPWFDTFVIEEDGQEKVVNEVIEHGEWSG